MRAPSYVNWFVLPTGRVRRSAGKSFVESLNRSQMPVSRKIYRLAPKTGYSIAADPLKKTSPADYSISHSSISMPTAPRPPPCGPISCAWCASVSAASKLRWRRAALQPPSGALPRSASMRGNRARFAGLTRAAARGQDGISSRPIETNSSLPPQPGKVPAPPASPGATNPRDRFTSGKIPPNCDRPREGSVRYPG
jgi:hypothetical protein